MKRVATALVQIVLAAGLQLDAGAAVQIIDRATAPADQVRIAALKDQVVTIINQQFLPSLPGSIDEQKAESALDVSCASARSFISSVSVGSASKLLLNQIVQACDPTNVKTLKTQTAAGSTAADSAVSY